MSVLRALFGASCERRGHSWRLVSSRGDGLATNQHLDYRCRRCPASKALMSYGMGPLT